MFSTATQPALEGLTTIRGLEGVREIVPDASELFETLKRVEYEVRLEPAGWRDLADEIAQHRKVLLILNTIRDARLMARLLSESRDDVLYLSGGLCGAHRRKVLAEVHRRLDKDLPCCLVSTQVVEAGVHIDFPTVYRAVGPLDSIVQAAGRCNREGGPVLGRVVVFSPYDKNLPKGDYRQRTDDSLAMLKQGIDLHDPGTYESYFRNYYEIANLDKKKVQDSRHSLQFRDTAQRYKLIEDGTSVVVPYDENAEAILASIDPSRVSRNLFRKLQPYTVSIHPNQQAKYEADGLLETVADGLIVWKGEYDKFGMS